MLIEGMGLRAATRLGDVSINGLIKLLVDIGSACAGYEGRRLRQLKCKRTECGEIWAFVYAREENVPEGKKPSFGFGGVRTWAATDANTKLIRSFLVGTRSARSAAMFIKDLKG
jgi:hypothetical protein